MDLTNENKMHIDSLSFEGLLSKWRFAPVGDAWFQGETGKYWGERMAELWGERMAELKAKNPGQAVAASKSIGWEK